MIAILKIGMLHFNNVFTQSLRAQFNRDVLIDFKLAQVVLEFVKTIDPALLLG
mgnify:CR=1 FL=1